MAAPGLVRTGSVNFSANTEEKPTSPSAFGLLRQLSGQHLEKARSELSETEQLKELERRLVDYDYETQIKRPEVTKDPLQDVVHYPDDDFSIRQQRNPPRIDGPVVPELDDFSFLNLEPYVRQSLQLYTQEYTIMEKKYEEHGRGRGAFPAEGDPHAAHVIAQVYEVDVEEDKEAEKAAGEHPPKERKKSVLSVFPHTEAQDAAAAARKERRRRKGASVVGAEFADDEEEELDLETLGPWSEQANAINAEQRKLLRQMLFKVYSDAISQVTPDQSNPRTLGEPNVALDVTTVTFEAKELMFAPPALEPYFCSVALYDIAAKKRISENFHFSLNTEYQLDMIGPKDETIQLPQPPVDPISLARSCVWNLDNKYPTVYVVIRVDKILQGDIEEASEPYMKFASLKPKEHHKLTEVARDFCNRLGRYRQCFAWAAEPLFGTDGYVAVKNEAGDPVNERTVTQFIRCTKELDDAHLFEMIEDIKTNTTKRHKVIPGKLKIELRQQFTFAPPGRISTSLQPVLPLLGAAEPKNYIREIQMFPTVEHPVPHDSYINNLYIYPEFTDMSNRKGAIKGRNLAVRVQVLSNDEVMEPVGLKIVHGRAHSEALLDSVMTGVQYHNKSPVFCDEIKIALPPKLTPLHHILFTIINVSVQAPKGKKELEVEEPVGFAWLPIYPDTDKRIIENKEYQLPVAEELLPGYLNLGGLNVESQIKYVDNKKLLFRVSTRLVSSVLTQDPTLNAFFEHYGNQDSKGLLKTATRNLLGSDSAEKTIEVVRFSTVLIDNLITLVCYSKMELAATAFNALLHILRVISDYDDDGGRNSILTGYVNYRFSHANIHRNQTEKKYPFIELVKQWVPILEKDDAKEDGLSFSYTLFDLIVKSMALYISEPEQKNVERKLRFTPKLLEDVRCLMILLRRHVSTLSKTGVILAGEVNRYVGLFVRDLMPLMDRGYVFELAQRYVRQFLPTATESLLHKFEFLRVICDYEHYMPLNLSLECRPQSYEMSEQNSMIESFWRQHMMAGLLLNELEVSLSYADRNNRQLGITVLRNLLMKHELDDRYTDTQRRLRVANIYFPLMRICAEHVKIITNMDLSEQRSILICFLWVLKNSARSLLEHWWQIESEERLHNFFRILVLAVDAFKYEGRAKYLQRKSADLNSNANQSRKAMLENMYSSNSRKTRKGTFKNSSLRYQKRASMVAGATGTLTPASSPSGSAAAASPTSAASTPTSAASTPPTPTSPSGADGKVTGPRGFAKLTLKKNATLTAGAHSQELDPWEHALETNLATESSLVVLDVLEDFISKFGTILAEAGGQNAMLGSVFKLFMALMDAPQSERTTSCLFASIRGFTHRFADALFNSVTTYCEELCNRILRLCNSNLPSTRRSAATLLYLLMRKNFDETGQQDFSRMKLQTTIALSRLAGESNLGTDNCLRKALLLVGDYASHDSSTALGAAFGQQVIQLVARLQDILRDSVKLESFNHDPEMKADLINRIADGYMNAPPLRVTWLRALMKFHADQGNLAEKAMCAVHLAALVTEFLTHIEPLAGYPQGYSAFMPVSGNTSAESAVSDASTDAASICQSDPFLPASLTELLKSAIECTTSAQLWEFSNLLYKLLIPIYELKREYSALSAAHADLKNYFDEIVKSIQAENRYLGTYYRIGFYGVGFEELNGQEYIYKEPKITRLMEISDRLRDAFSKHFGADKFEIIQDSNVVDPAALKPEKNYVQITSLEPHFDAWELKERLTTFERSTNLTRFMFETPFTKSGKAHGGVADQYRRKTVLTVERSFPYLCKRIRVIKREETVLTPIENAIDEIERRVEKMGSELKGKETNPKKLQMVLQGSVRLQVNAGPMEICRVFLGNADQHPPQFVRRLRDGFRDFLRVCGEALKLNADFIGDDQLAYQKDLEVGYKETKEQLEVYLDPTPSGQARARVFSNGGLEPYKPDAPATPKTPGTPGSEVIATAEDAQNLKDVVSVLD